ncbi:MAG: YdeI/OmpD-associated family protein [Candidatus Didemnitutus sp.]|nr:YdeI/OmpD-associated family protein [Candidatus Didemnitutus sp.]
MPHAADPRIDAYLAKAAPFARPILAHLRALVHRAVPDAAETIKWGMPFFTVENTPLCNFAAFKAHTAFGFWRRDITEEFEKLHANGTAMGAAGRIASLADLPADKVIVTFLKQAAERTRAGLPPRPKRKIAPRRPLRVPADLVAALKKNKTAAATWAKFSYSHRKDYVEWITEAKRPATRATRLATTLAWLAEGKTRNWKYERC